MRFLIVSCLLCLNIFCFAQIKKSPSFYGKTTGEADICPQGKAALTDQDVNNMITEMLQRYGLRNRYVLVPCAQIDNCLAMLFDNKPYILYNTSFLNTVKRLNFSDKIISASDKDWETLTILAHELGHHLNNHLNNPYPGATLIDMELEADETAGFIIYLMGGSLVEAQFAFSNTSSQASYTHPGRQDRMNAVAKGWRDARGKYPRLDDPKEPVVVTPSKSSSRMGQLNGSFRIVNTTDDDVQGLVHNEGSVQLSYNEAEKLFYLDINISSVTENGFFKKNGKSYNTRVLEFKQILKFPPSDKEEGYADDGDLRFYLNEVKIAINADVKYQSKSKQTGKIFEESASKIRSVYVTLRNLEMNEDESFFFSRTKKKEGDLVLIFISPDDSDPQGMINLVLDTKY